MKEAIKMNGLDLQSFLSALEDTNKGASEGVTEETKLSDISIDSLDLFSVIGNFEDNSGKTLPDEDFEKMSTVGDFLKFFS